MNKILLISYISVTSFAFEAFASCDVFQIVSCMIDRYTTSTEWDDNVDERHAGEAEIEFPTPDSLFSCEFPTNSAAAGLTADEKQHAFDQFLLDLSRTNRNDISMAYETTGAYALVFCAELGYTNGFNAATSILSRVEAPCQAESYAVVRKLVSPSIENNEYVYTILTNQLRYSVFNRNALLSDYATRLRHTEKTNGWVLTNGVAMLRRASPSVRAKMPLDELLACVIPEYIVSSNRLAYAQSVLEMPEVTQKEVQYFSAVTNMLFSSGRRLQNIALP